MTEPPTDPGFAPADPTDDRDQGEWETRYHDPKAKTNIRIEAIYLFVHLFGVIAAVFAIAFCTDIGLLTDNAHRNEALLEAPQSQLSFGWRQLAHAWLGGILGGSVYSLKWLIHVVAKNIWNIDRRLWRLLTPHISGALAYAFIIILASGLFVIIDKDSLSSVWVCFGLGFLIGYFSDNATAKLSEMARTLFGATKQSIDSNDDNNGKKHR